MVFQSRLAQLESDVADMKMELGMLLKGDRGTSGEAYRTRLAARRCEAWSRYVVLLGMMMAALARAFGWI